MINKLDSDLNFDPLQRLAYTEQCVYMWIRNYPSLSTSPAYQRFLFHEQNTIRQRIKGAFSIGDIDLYCEFANRFLDYVYSLRLNPYTKESGMNELEQYIKEETQENTQENTYLRYLAH